MPSWLKRRRVKGKLGSIETPWENPWVVEIHRQYTCTPMYSQNKRKNTARYEYRAITGISETAIHIHIITIERNPLECNGKLGGYLYNTILGKKSYRTITGFRVGVNSKIFAHAYSFPCLFIPPTRQKYCQNPIKNQELLEACWYFSNFSLELC